MEIVLYDLGSSLASKKYPMSASIKENPFGFHSCLAARVKPEGFFWCWGIKSITSNNIEAGGERPTWPGDLTQRVCPSTSEHKTDQQAGNLQGVLLICPAAYFQRSPLKGHPPALRRQVNPEPLDSEKIISQMKPGQRTRPDKRRISKHRMEEYAPDKDLCCLKA